MTGALRFAIVGCGYITQAEHVPSFLTLLPDIDVVATADPDRARAEGVAAPFRARAYSDLTALLGAEEVGAVLIATRAPTHARLIAEAAAAGKPILVEKPIAYSLEEARQAAAAVEAAGVPCVVAYHRRYDDDCQRVKELIDSGAIGEVRAAVSSCRLVFPPIYRRYADASRPAPAEPVQDLPSDWLAENSIHHINLLRYWLGDVTKIHGAVYAKSNHDLGIVTLEFENRVLVSHHQLRNMECGEEITLYGTRGNIRVELWYPHRPYRFPRVTQFRIDPPGWTEHAFPRSNPYTNQIRHFANVVRGHAENRSGLRDSYRDLEILKGIIDRAVYLDGAKQRDRI